MRPSPNSPPVRLASETASRPGAVGDLLASHLGSPLAPALRARRVLVLTQSVFFGTLAVCLVIRHGVVTRIDGISYYGVYAPTVPLIVVGYLTAAVGLWRAGGLLVAPGCGWWPPAWSCCSRPPSTAGRSSTGPTCARG